MSGWPFSIFDSGVEKYKREIRSEAEVKSINVETANREEFTRFVLEQKSLITFLNEKSKDLDLSLQEEKRRVLIEQELRMKADLQIEEHEKKIEKLNNEIKKFTVMLDVEMQHSKLLQDKSKQLEDDLKRSQKDIKPEDLTPRTSLPESKLSETLENEKMLKWKALEQLQGAKHQIEQIGNEKNEMSHELEQERIAKSQLMEKLTQTEKEKNQFYQQLGTERLKHMGKVTQLEMELNRVKQELERSGLDKNRVVAQMDKATQEIQILLKNSYQYQRDKEILSDKMKKFEQDKELEIRQLNDLIKQLEIDRESQLKIQMDKIQSLEKIKDSLQKQYHQSLSNIDKHQEQIKKLQASNATLTEESAEYQTKISRISELLTNLQAVDKKQVIETLQTEKEQVTEQLNIADDKIVNLTELIKVQEDEKEKIQKALQDVNRVLGEQLQQKQYEYDQLKEQIESDQSSISEKLSKYQKENEQLQEEIKSETESKHKIISELDEEKSKLIVLEGKYQSLLHTNKQLLDDIKTEQVTKSYLVDELEAQKALKLQLEEEIKTEKKLNKKLQRQIESNHQNNNNSHGLGNSNNNMNQPESPIKLKLEIDELRKKLQTMHTEEEWSNVNSKYLQQRDLLSRAGNQIKELTDTIQKNVLEHTNFKNTISSLRIQNDNLTNEKNNFLQDFEKYRNYEQKNRFLEEKIKDLELELERTRESTVKDSTLLAEIRLREDAKLYDNSDIHFEQQIDDQEKKIKSIEGQILRLSILQKDLDLKEQNLKKSRERFLERLQAAGDKPNTTLLELANLQSKKEIELLQAKVEEQYRMLMENENILDLLQVQTKLLKGEIRNYERYVKREENYKNLEYMKNIIFKYLQSHNEQLVPVICNLLQFSPEENNLVRSNSRVINRMSTPASLTPRSQTESNGVKRTSGFWF